MFVEQFVDSELGNSAYLIGIQDMKTAIMIDPLRDVDRYLARADQLGVTIKYVLETHLHNDFISGAREISARSGARIGASAKARLGFDHHPLVENDLIPFGSYELKVMETPGHSPEHLSYLLADIQKNKPLALFSGGALMVGGAARTDLLGENLARPFAGALFHTMREKLMALPDDVLVYPTHGAGSLCAAPASNDRVTTIGKERWQNPLLQSITEDEFIRNVLMNLPPYPPYFREMRPINQKGPEVLGSLPRLNPLSPYEVSQLQESGSVILDVRHIPGSEKTYIFGSCRIPLSSRFSSSVGWLIPFLSRVILVGDSEEDRLEAVRRLIRIGYETLSGYLEGGMRAWRAAGLPARQLEMVSVEDLSLDLEGKDPPVVLDVRQEEEWREGHIPGAVHIEYWRLPQITLAFPPDRKIAVHCETQNRSPSGITTLAKRGYENLLLVEGGFLAWQKAGLPIERGE